jgi:hypothetical protein
MLITTAYRCLAAAGGHAAGGGLAIPDHQLRDGLSPVSPPTITPPQPFLTLFLAPELLSKGLLRLCRELGRERRGVRRLRGAELRARHAEERPALISTNGF